MDFSGIFIHTPLNSHQIHVYARTHFILPNNFALLFPSYHEEPVVFISFFQFFCKSVPSLHLTLPDIPDKTTYLLSGLLLHVFQVLVPLPMMEEDSGAEEPPV